MEPNERLDAVFFCSSTGTEPVRDWLKRLNADQRKAIGEDIRTAQYGWPIGIPLIRKLEVGLWEVRTHLRSGIARTLFTVDAKRIILLHGLIKKSKKHRKTNSRPPDDDCENFRRNHERKQTYRK